jgi:hypothetical protein
MYQIFSTTASVDDGKAPSTASAAPASAAASTTAASATASLKPLRFSSHRNQNQTLPAGVSPLRLAFFSTELGPDMRFDRMCVALTAPSASASATATTPSATTASGAAPHFVMTQIDAAAIERGELFEKQSTPAKPALAFDCIIFPGGAVWEEQAAISDAAAQALAKYVHAGGGWFGTCAGGALCVPPCPSFHSYPAYARAACFLCLLPLFSVPFTLLSAALCCAVCRLSRHIGWVQR